MKPTMELRRVHRVIANTDQVPIVLQQKWAGPISYEWRDVPLVDVYVHDDDPKAPA